MNKKAREFDLINLNDYKSYYQDTTKEEIINDTYLDYCAYRNTLTQLNIANKKIEELKTKYKKEDIPKCEQCRWHKTMNCPNSNECYETISKPYFKEKMF